MSLTLPQGWSTVNLGDVLLAVVGGGTPSRSVSAYFRGSIPWFTVKDMKVTRPSDAEEHISEAAVKESATNLIPPNTLIIATRIALGKAIKPTVACAINQDLKALIPATGVNSDFLLYWIIANEGTIQNAGSGTTVNGIRLETLRALPLMLPPSPEQTRIAEKLEELLSDLDAGVAELKAAQKKLVLYRQSLLKAAVEGTLTSEWRAERTRRGEATESGAELLQRILKERRRRWEEKQLAKFKEQGRIPPKGWQEKYPEPLPPDTENLPALPEGWVWASIDQLADVRTGSTPLRSKSGYYNEGTIPWVTSGALNAETVSEAAEFVTDLALTECHLEVYPAGALLIAMYGEGKTRGKCSELLIPATINQAIAALIFGEESEYCKPYAKLFLLNSYEKMRAQASGGVQPNLNMQIIKALVLPLPPFFEQNALTRLLSAQLVQIAQRKNEVELGLKQAAAQRKNILKAAFSGQLVPQDPDDEPASVLLERIRAERMMREKPVKNPGGRVARTTAC